jgi:hypothetical protein
MHQVSNPEQNAIVNGLPRLISVLFLIVASSTVWVVLTFETEPEWTDAIRQLTAE